MELFAVYRVGVYIQDCAGIFSTEEKARSEAIRLLEGEGDDYHDFEVCKYQLDLEAPSVEIKGRRCRFDHIYEEAGESLARYTKRGGIVKEMDD